MAAKGISRDRILAKTIELVERKGVPNVSMREIAEALQIKTPSLYNHIKSMDQLYAEVSRYAAEALRKALLDAMEGMEGDDALCALAGAYRCFAKEHKGLYKVILSLPSLEGDILVRTTAAVAEPIFSLLSQYGLSQEQSVHGQRILRSVMHGFIDQEEAGFFSREPVSVEESYQAAIQCFLLGVHAGIGGE